MDWLCTLPPSIAWGVLVVNVAVVVVSVVVATVVVAVVVVAGVASKEKKMRYNLDVHKS